MKMSQEKSKTMPMQIFWAVKAVYYGIVQVENNRISATVLSNPKFQPNLSANIPRLLTHHGVSLSER